MRRFLTFLTLSFAGAGLYFAGIYALDRFTFFEPEVHPVVKKISVVKPKNFYSDRKAFRQAVTNANEDFTFFKVLNDPSMSKMVGLDGEVFKKHSSAKPVKNEKAYKQYPSSPVSKMAGLDGKVFKKHPSAKPVKNEKAYKIYQSSPVRAGKEEIHRKKVTPVAPPRVEKRAVRTVATSNTTFEIQKAFQEIESIGLKKAEPKKSVAQELSTFLSYVVQVSSFRDFERAEALRSVLASKGYASFVGKTVLPNNKGTWHRVYIGRYLDRAGAESAAANFQRAEKRPAMVIRQAG
ncbi:MAG: hypothetical protein NPINA01_31860 [Nitrospinaceae bacterium]|nr:MAG: hypothetical protein NPINA01_31860 [Nitrospinaceae bacterium]